MSTATGYERVTKDTRKPVSSPQPRQALPGDGQRRREQLLWVLAAATFLIFFQAFMVAPLLPRLARLFGVSVGTMGLVVPAYLIPYGLATLLYGPLSDRFGRGPVIYSSLVAFVGLTAITGAASSWWMLFSLRLLTGLGASGVVPIALALIADLFPFDERGRPLGILFGAMAGGMAFGSTAGAVLEPYVGWRGLFVGVAGLEGTVVLLLLPYRSILSGGRHAARMHFGEVVAGYWQLLIPGRSRRTYGYVLFNSVFHAGVFTWLGFYFERRYGLGEVGIGLALLGYGLPGFLFGPLIGRGADRWGRALLLPMGLVIGAASAAALALDLPLLGAAVLVTTLSLGYDMTQPLFAGIVTDLSANKGQAMGVMAFTLFSGFGLGSLVFSALLGFGLNWALVLFGAGELLAGLAGVRLFAGESNS